MINVPLFETRVEGAELVENTVDCVGGSEGGGSGPVEPGEEVARAVVYGDLEVAGGSADRCLCGC